MNPIIVLDKIDKVGDGRDGKAPPQQQVMEITDASIKEWTDDYIKISINKQPIWFILTANYADQIAPVLWDRVQVIHVGAQTPIEKHHCFYRQPHYLHH